MREGKGKISRIFQNETRNGKQYWVVAIQSAPGKFERLSVWDYNFLSGISEGDTISYKFEQKGKYSNIVEITKAEKSNVGASETLEYQGGGGIDQIRRMSVIKSASQLLMDYKADPQEKINKTLEAAREFEKYVLGDGNATDKDE